MELNIIKKRLTPAESALFVSNVADFCFMENEEDGTTTYIPSYKYLATQQTFAQLYTDYERVEDFDENNENYLDIDINTYIAEEKIDGGQWFAMMEAINEEISFKKEQLLRKSPLDDLLLEITKIIKKLDKFDMNEVTTLLPQLAKLDIGNLSEEKLINAIIKTMPQDHKKKATSKSRTKKTTSDKVVPIENKGE